MTRRRAADRPHHAAARLALALALAAWLAPSGAELYKCVRADGKAMFQDHPCPQGTSGARISGAPKPEARPAARPPANTVPWDEEAQRAFIADCVRKLADQRMSDFARSRGAKLPADVLERWRTELAAPCGCVQKNAASFWRYDLFLADRGNLEPQLMTASKDCFR